MNTKMEMEMVTNTKTGTKMIRRVDRMLKPLLAACLALGFATAATAQSQALRLGHGIAAEHPLGQGALHFAKILAENSDGKITMKVFPATQLGSEGQMISAVRGGVQDLVITSTAPVATQIKEYLLFDLPFLVESDAEADLLLDGPIGQKLLDLAETRNMIGLCYWENGFRQVTNSRKAVERLEDIGGLKLRTMQNPVYIDAFKALGANAIPMPFTELYTAMETRAIDAQENPVAIIHSNKFYEVQKYVTLTNHAYAPYVVLMSKSAWKKAGPQGQKILRETCHQARDYQRKLSREMTAQMLEQLQKEGMTLSRLPASEIERLREKIQPIVDKYTKEIGAELVEQTQQQLQQIRTSAGNKS